ncbi:very short patch repair endonuclease [Curtobacterium sp. MCLR17_040]|uniref:very short patch repair endonuclease n=1 Tax=Curtobacterium sp. MCLR17_040 TaxID=2175625 RepID=UPI000DA821D4|nr:very short patch repair endonuclease [Curtobacterium sp. MCLR17_040]PZF02828.1 very short patch repair endonuclease [Curtobacterium sp. MCLR17_040]
MGDETGQVPPAPAATAAGVAKSMRGNRARNTAPELAIRRALHRRGARFRVDFRLQPPMRTRADVVFTRQRVAVFIDGCFWHGCPAHGTTPKTNTDYWGPKLARNRERDADTTVALQASGWTVLRFWEHEDPAAVVERVIAEVQSR